MNVKRIGAALYGYRKPFIVVLALAVLSLIIWSFFETLNYRFSFHPPTIDQLKDGLNADLHFKSPSLRKLAKAIYLHRARYEHNDPAASDQFVGIFPRLNTDKTPPPINNDTPDIVLYKLATAPRGRFSVMLAYIPIFAHEWYPKCINAYDPATKTFRKIDDTMSTREVIIKNVLGIGTPNIESISDSIKDCLIKTQAGYDPTSITNKISKSNELISLVLETMPEEDLYRLLAEGYIGSQ